MPLKPVVELVEHPWPLVLIPWPSGVDFEVQAGGLGTYHMRMEGICLPLLQGEELRAALGELHPGCARWLTSAEADRLDAVLDAAGVPLRVLRERLRESYEAWVHVRVLPGGDEVLGAFAGRDAVLTWENCD